jgi:ABC-type methionine transport system ATPase subunit
VLPDGVSLSLPVGEMLGLIGSHGAGKPTLLRLPEGLAPPDADGVMLLGRRMEDRPPGRGLRHASGTGPDADGESLVIPAAGLSPG